MNKTRLMNKREEKIMELLWESGKSMTVADIECHFASENIGKVTVFKAVQSLEEKEYIRVNGVEKTGKAYARKFEPNITKEGYAAIMLSEKGIGSESIGGLAMAMIGEDRKKRKNRKAEEKLIDELQYIINKLTTDGR